MGRGNARRDAQRDMGNSSTNCPHSGQWDSVGPTIDETGRSCTIYSCGECGKKMRTHYYN